MRADDCFFAEHLIHFIKTPMFALQPRYDQWQLHHVVGSNYKNIMNIFGMNITNIVTKRLLANHLNGAFIDSCTHHCTSCSSIGEDSWNGPRIVADTFSSSSSSSTTTTELMTAARAFQLWHTDTLATLIFLKGKKRKNRLKH